MKGLDFALLKKVRDEMRDQLTDRKSSGNSGKKKLERAGVSISQSIVSVSRTHKIQKDKIKTFKEGQTSYIQCGRRRGGGGGATT